MQNLYEAADKEMEVLFFAKKPEFLEAKFAEDKFIEHKRLENPEFWSKRTQA